MNYQRLFAAGLLLCAFGAAAQPSLTDILAKMPAQNAEEVQANNTALLQLGAQGVTELCARLTGPGKGDNTNVEFALNGLAKYAARPGAENDRKVVAGALAAALQSIADPDVKAFIIRQLQVTGREESVAPLAALLADETLCEPATQALLAIHTREVPPALAAALKTAQGKNRVTLIKAVGELQYRASQSDLLAAAQGEDAAAKDAALIALAHLGIPEAKDLLAAQVAATTGLAHGRAITNYLQYAKQCAIQAKPAECEEILRAFLKSEEPANVCAALNELVWLLRLKAFPDVLAAMDHPDIEVRGAALKLAPAFPGNDFTRQWMEKAKQATPAVHIEILNMLADRGDNTASTAILAAAKDADPTLRLAGVQLLPRFMSAEILPVLFQNLVNASDEAEIAVIKGALLRSRDPKLTDAATMLLPSAPLPARKALVAILAARRAEDKADAVLALTGDTDPGMRLAVIQALGGVCNADNAAKIIPLLLEPKSEDEGKAAAASLVAALKNSQDTEARIAPLLAALAQAPDTGKPVLLRLLPELGGAQGLQAAAALAGSSVPEIRDAAVRAVCAWTEALVLPELNTLLANAPEADYLTLAADAATRVIHAAALSPEEKVAKYKEALSAAKRPEEKKSLLGGLQDLRNIDALRLASGYIADEALKAEAAAAMVKIACPPKEGEAGLTGGEALGLLKQAADALQDENLRKKAEAHLASPK